MTARLLLCAASVLLAGCSVRLSPLPTGPGSGFPDYAGAYEQATERCRGVRTWAGLMDLSGRAGDTRLSGTIEAGFAEPGQVRMEARVGFGARPVFVMVARGGVATLVLPRDRRVLHGEPPAAVVEALAGVPLEPDELRAIVSGCGFGVVTPLSGRAFDRGRASVEGGGTTTWIRQERGTWRLAAAAKGPVEVRYSEFVNDRPTRIRIRNLTDASRPLADLTLTLSDVDTNVELGRNVFEATPPEDALPMTLDELRRAGPLGSTEQGNPR